MLAFKKLSVVTVAMLFSFCAMAEVSDLAPFYIVNGWTNSIVIEYVDASGLGQQSVIPPGMSMRGISDSDVGFCTVWDFFTYIGTGDPANQIGLSFDSTNQFVITTGYSSGYLNVNQQEGENIFPLLGLGSPWGDTFDYSTVGLADFTTGLEGGCVIGGILFAMYGVRIALSMVTSGDSWE